MNKDIRKYIASCSLCHREKGQGPDLPTTNDRDSRQTFDRIAINLVVECETPTLGNKHILTIIDHLTG